MKKVVNNFKLILASFLLLANVGVSLLPVAVNAGPKEDACDGLRIAQGQKATGAACADDKGAGLGKIISTIITVLSIVVGAVSVIMIIVGGFRYVISGGDSNATQGAKNTIMYALIGLVIVLFAQVIVRFVISNASK